MNNFTQTATVTSRDVNWCMLQCSMQLTISLYFLILIIFYIIYCSQALIMDDFVMLALISGFLDKSKRADFQEPKSVSL